MPPPTHSPYEQGEPEPSGTRRPRKGGKGTRRRVSPVQAAAGVAVVGVLGAGGWYWASRDDSVPLSATLGTEGATSGQPGTGTIGGGPGVSAASLQVPKGLDIEHLLARVTYGATDALRADVARRGPAAWLAAQFAPATVTDPGGDGVAKLFPRLALRTTEAARSGVDPAALQRELAAAHLGRAVWSSRQLFEILVDLWSNHFNIPCPGEKAAFSRHRFDADILRTGALGPFEALLQASAIHPAMLEHLDGAASSGDSPNEHYARELLEAHTVGPGQFTERDVQQAALLFTGFQVRDGAPRFVPARHHVGRVTVLGLDVANDKAEAGPAAVKQLLGHLARHPATATAVARRLAVRFVADDPPDALVRRLAAAYTSSGTAIAPVLSELLTSAEFVASPGAKLRRPMERLAATARTLGVTPGPDAQGLLDLYWMLDAAGHRPLGSPDPGGYPDVATAWQSPAVALGHFNATAQLVHGWWPKGLVTPGPGKLLRTPPGTRAAAIDAVARRVLGRAPSAAEQAAAEKLLVESQLPGTLARGSWEQKETIGLVATLLLCSPAALRR